MYRLIRDFDGRTCQFVVCAAEYWLIIRLMLSDCDTPKVFYNIVLINSGRLARELSGF